MQTCKGVPGPQGSSEGASGLVTQWSCHCLVPLSPRGCFLRDGPGCQCVFPTADGFSAQDQRCHPVPDWAGLP